MTEPTLTRDDIVEGYRTFFGRLPESEQVIEETRATHSTAIDLWRTLAASDEFAVIRSQGLNVAKNTLKSITDAYGSGPAPVEYDVSPATMAALVRRIQDQWTILGETEPHWSVLTDDLFRADNLDDLALANFNESGLEHANLIAHFENRTGSKAAMGLCLELGCGVGRITRHLAERFERVMALDISPGNLRLCREYMDREQVSNVDIHQISSVSDFEELPEIDFFFSMIVLQHNSPPIQKLMLDEILKKIRPGGGALFQIPTDIVEYRFSADDYLASPDQVMEIHALPRPVVLDLLQRNGLQLRDLAPDGYIGVYGSETFFAIKPR